MSKRKSNILIVDSSQLNRMTLRGFLKDQYNIIETDNGQNAIEIIKERKDIDLILLDLYISESNNYPVFKELNKLGLIEYIPVIVISSNGDNASMEKAYELGATDYIKRPFESYIVNRRVKNALVMFERQRKLINLVEQQLQQRLTNNTTLINVLGHIVEFRNNESGLHVQHIQTITKLLLLALTKRTDKYKINDYDILKISTASSLHDVGKIAIDEKILNKPGKLTSEEFEIMKTHTVAGAEMIQKISNYEENELLNIAYQICRWHHERYDGNGYPDGLKGDEIPISAQVVSLADVYDALTSERCYKKAFSHEKAMSMILDGQCGTFNPLLLECLKDIEEDLKSNLFQDMYYADGQVVSRLIDEVLDKHLTKNEEVQVSDNLKHKNMEDFSFKYDASKEEVEVSQNMADKFGMSTVHKGNTLPFLNENDMTNLSQRLHQTTPQNPAVDVEFAVEENDEKKWYRAHAKALWQEGQYVGAIGQIEKASRIPKFTQKNALLQYDDYQIHEVVKYLSEIFDSARLIDVKNYSVLYATEHGLERTEEKCYGLWERKEPCTNCIARKAYEKKGQVVKLKFVDRNIYGIIAEYIEINHQPYVLELVCQTEENVLLSSYGKSQFMDKINDYNKQYYQDILTKTYDRRYFEEIVKGMDNVVALAMIDANEFKEINDHYGHAVGDEALVKLSQAIKDCIRKEDYLIRYGGDEFVLVFQNIEYSDFKNVLDRISKHVQEISVSDNLHLSVSIGGIYNITSVNKALDYADQLMYKGKKEHKRVVIEKK